MAGLERTGGSLRLHVGHRARLFAADEIAGFLIVEDFAPGFLQAHDGGAVPAGHVREAVAEVSVGQNREFFARLDEIGDCGFHAAGARSGDGDVEFVGGGEGVTQQLADVLHHLEKVRIQVARRWAAAALRRRAAPPCWVPVPAAGAAAGATGRAVRGSPKQCIETLAGDFARP